MRPSYAVEGEKEKGGLEKRDRDLKTEGVREKKRDVTAKQQAMIHEIM